MATALMLTAGATPAFLAPVPLRPAAVLRAPEAYMQEVELLTPGLQEDSIFPEVDGSVAVW